MSESITVVGGVGGTHARLEDLDRAVALLEMIVTHLEAIGRAARTGSHLVSGVPVPLDRIRERDRAVDDLAWIDRGSGGATGTALEIGDIAGNLKEVVHLLDEAEKSAQSRWGWLTRGWDKILALGSIAFWVPCKVVGATVGTFAHAVEDHTPAWVPAHWIAAGGGWVADTVNPDWAPNLAPLVYGDDLEALLSVMDQSYDGFVNAGTLFLGPPASPGDFVETVSGTLAFISGALDEILGDVRDVMVFPIAIGAAIPPDGMADLLGRLGGLAPNGVDGESRIAIDRLENPDGTRSWIVEIPGTQDWMPNGGTNPFDTTSNLQLMSGGESDVTRAVESAMERVGILPGEEVMLVGHSQGGIAAMALASTPSFTDKYTVSAVLTAGAPVGWADPAPGIEVLSLEHQSDTVLALDASKNPDRADWVTVRRDLGASGNEIDRRADNDIVGRHDLATYQRTAAVVEEQYRYRPSVGRWLDDTEPFWSADGRTCTRIVFETTRSTQGPVLPSKFPIRVLTATLEGA